MAVADASLAGRFGALEWAARAAAWAGIVFLVVAVPVLLPLRANDFSLAVIYAIVGLSLNVLIGHAGQISLGHQGFFGVGAFMSAYTVTVWEQTFWAGLVVGAISGAVASLLMGMAALRVRGLYLALVTLVYGRMAEESLFTLKPFGEGAGLPAPRPAGFESGLSYYFLCLAVLLVVWYVDWRFTRSKAGRAVAAVRENEQVAASYGIPVAQYKLLAFVLSGIFVGLAGSLVAHQVTQVSPQTFDFRLALFFVILTVVGGLRSRPGIVLWAAVLTIVPTLFQGGSAPFVTEALSSALLVVVLVFKPGGIGQLISPVTSWLAGGPFRGRDEEWVEEGVRGRP